MMKQDIHPSTLPSQAKQKRGPLITLLITALSAAPALAIDSGGIYRITPKLSSGRCVEVPLGATAAGTGVINYDYYGLTNQCWLVTDDGGGYWRLSPLSSPDKALDVNGGANTDGTKVQIWGHNTSSAQRWQIASAGGGYVQLKPACAPGSALSLKSGNTANGNDYYLYTDYDTDPQLFQMQWVAESPVASLLPTPPAGKQWSLHWNDEFTGAAVDQNKWGLESWVRRRGYWRPQTAFTTGTGKLVMRTEYANGEYRSPGMTTRQTQPGNGYSKTYGYFEIRCKLPVQPGYWTSFWLFSDDVYSEANQGNDGTEIDIFESPFRNGGIHHALHWDGYGAAHQSASHTSWPANIQDGGYHVFGVWWNPWDYIFYVDGVEVWRTSAGGVCDVPLHLRLTSEVDWWAGDIANAILPEDVLVDYVRVYDLVNQ